MKPLKLLFVCNIVEVSKHQLVDGYQAAALSFQQKLLGGFEKNGAIVELLSEPLIPSWSRNYKILNSKGYVWSRNNNSHDECVGFLNVFPFKNILISHSFKRAIKKWIKSNSDFNCAIVAYSPRYQYINSCKYASKLGVSNCLIVPDLPEFSGISRMSNPIYRSLKQIDIKHFYKTSKYVGSFALFTKTMAERFHKDIVSTTIECIVDDDATVSFSQTNNQEKRIVYTGGIEEEYGIKLLLDAFSLINDDNYHLDICGSGNAQELVKKYVLKNNRIHYYGLISREKAVSIQKRATLLVNPRYESDFTKYSFPSKNAEYIMSGKPVICFKLEGIPDEYDKCFIYFRSKDLGMMAEDLVSASELSPFEREKKAKDAFLFLKSYSNSKRQAGKIIELIK